MWFVNNKWFRYFVFRDFVWCVYCVLFGKLERVLFNQVGIFSFIKGVLDWGNIGRFVKLYISQLFFYYDVVIKGDNYLSIVSGKQKDICSYLLL